MMYDATMFVKNPAEFRRVWKGGRVELTGGRQLPVSRVSNRMVLEYRIQAVFDAMTQEWVGANPTH